MASKVENGGGAHSDDTAHEDEEENLKRLAAAEAITMLSRSFKNKSQHVCALPVETITNSADRTKLVKKRDFMHSQQPVIPPVPVVSDESSMPTVVSDVLPKTPTSTPISVPRTPPMPGCDLIMVEENSIPIPVMSREQLAAGIKRPAKSSSPRNLPPKKRRVHVSPPRSENQKSRPEPPKTLPLMTQLTHPSPLLESSPSQYSPCVPSPIRDLNTDQAVEFVRNQLDAQLHEIDRRSRMKNPKPRSESSSTPVSSPTKTPLNFEPQLKFDPPNLEAVEKVRGWTAMRRSVSYAGTPSPRMAEKVKLPAEDIVPGSAAAMAIAEKLRERMMKKDEDGDIALHIAVVHGNLHLVRVLISMMSKDGHSLDVTNGKKQTPLHLSVLADELSVMRMLLNGGANPNLGDRLGNNCYHLCVKQMNLDALQILIEESQHQPDLTACNNEGFTPLHVASQARFNPGIVYLVSQKADVNAKDGKSGRTPLFHAVEKGDYETCNQLIKLGASPEIANYAGFTPFAAAPKNSQICVLLSSYFPGKKATPKPDQIQGQAFPEHVQRGSERSSLKPAVNYEVISKLKSNLLEKSEIRDSRSPDKVIMAMEGVEPPSPTGDPAQASIMADVRREVMFPDSFRRASSKPKTRGKPGRPVLRRSESMPSNVKLSQSNETALAEPSALTEHSVRAYSPVSEDSNDKDYHSGVEKSTPDHSRDREESSSRIIERIKEMKRSLPSPVELANQSSKRDADRPIGHVDRPTPHMDRPTAPVDRLAGPIPVRHPFPLMYPNMSANLVPVLTMHEGTPVQAFMPYPALLQYNSMGMISHPWPPRVPVPLPGHVPMHMLGPRPLRSPTSPKKVRKQAPIEEKPKETKSEAAKPLYDKVASMASPIQRPISPDSGTKGEEKEGSACVSTMKEEQMVVTSEADDSKPPLKLEEEKVIVDSNNKTSEPVDMNVDDFEEPDLNRKLEIACDPLVTTSTGSTESAADSSCPDLPMFSRACSNQVEGSRSPDHQSRSPERRPMNLCIAKFPESILERFTPTHRSPNLPPVSTSTGQGSEVKIDKKDLFSKLRSKVRARLSPQSSFEHKHAPLQRSSSVDRVPYDRVKSMEADALPSVLQDVD